MTTVTLTAPDWLLALAILVALANALVGLRLSIYRKRLIDKQSRKIAELEARLRQARIRLTDFGVFTLVDTEEGR